MMTKALELVREIARSSPLSEWKLFVRGLAAFYRRDRAEAQANWDRLDADRAPFRIVKRLRSLEAGKHATAGPGSELRRPGKHGLRRERSSPFERAEGHSGEQGGQWTEISPQDPRVAGRACAGWIPGSPLSLTRSLIDPLVLDAADRRLRVRADASSSSSSGSPSPCAIDPSWNRLWGLVWEGPQGDPRRPCRSGRSISRIWKTSRA